MPDKNLVCCEEAANSHLCEELFMTVDYFNYDKDVTLVQRICTMIREMIRDDIYIAGSRLPNEIVLAEQFRVSRVTIRAALQMLEQSGIIIRRRGIGTFVAKESPFINNLSTNSTITESIRAIGAKSGTAYVNVDKHYPLNVRIKEQLCLHPNQEMVVIERVRTANGDKVTYSRDILCQDLYFDLLHGLSEQEFQNRLGEDISLAALIKSSIKKPIHHAIAHIIPMLCTEPKISKLLEIDENALLMEIEQVNYDTNSDPIWLTQEYHIPSTFTYTVYRTC